MTFFIIVLCVIAFAVGAFVAVVKLLATLLEMLVNNIKTIRKSARRNRACKCRKIRKKDMKF